MDFQIENEEIKKYFETLAKDIPDFLIEYANVPNDYVILDKYIVFA